MPHLDPTQIRCEIHTFKEGFLSALGHDLRLLVTGAQVDVQEAPLALTATFDAASIRVLGPLSGGALSDKDKGEIERNIRDTVLETARYPQIRFVAATIEPLGDGYRVSGHLELHGQRRPLTLTSRRDGPLQRATLALQQPDFGIKPYRAPLGVIKIKPEIRIELALPWPPAA